MQCQAGESQLQPPLPSPRGPTKSAPYEYLGIGIIPPADKGLMSDVLVPSQVSRY